MDRIILILIVIYIACDSISLINASTYILFSHTENIIASVFVQDWELIQLKGQ